MELNMDSHTQIEDYIFPGMDFYIQKSEWHTWEHNRLLHSLKILQDEKLHIFITGAYESEKSEILHYLVSGNSQTSTINSETISVQVFQTDHLCLWMLPDLGKSETSLCDQQAEYIFTHQENVHSNLFIILIILSTRRFGISYEQAFIKSLRERYKNPEGYFDRHLIIAFREESSKKIEFERFKNESREAFRNNLSLYPEIIAFDLQQSDSSLYLSLKKKLLIRAAALYQGSYICNKLEDPPL